ncbi:MAG: hypothetical protein L6264_07325 [Weeksellaceae bacterium]|nr:hypothetical protein [Bacteroidota bacterium]MCG2780744.1 hypothetical protein [Weeksellaceae bacterium]
MKHTDLAQDYFERHSRSNECHITSDGRVFHTSGHAISFAQENNLQDQKIESYTRDQVETNTENDSVENSNDTSNLEVHSNDVLLGNDSDNGNDSDKDDSDQGDDSKDADLSAFDSPAGQIALDVFLANNDVDTMKYNDLKALVKHFELETDDLKADTLKAALTEYKNNLAQ